MPSARVAYKLRRDFADRRDRAVESLRSAGVFGAKVGVVLGSGLGNVVDRLEVRASVDFGEVPGFHTASVQAHAGKVVQARHGGGDVLVLQGRLHAYEGHAMEDVVLPMAVMAGLGCDVVVLTNAAGGLHPDMRPGDLAVLTGLIDMHLLDVGRGLLELTKSSVDPELRLRSLRAGRLFDRDLSSLMVETGADESIALRTATYASLWGPNYEEPTMISVLRGIRADAVGMSTGPEAALLHALGVRVVGVSCITNVHVEHGGVEVSHEEVIEVGASRRDDMAKLLLAALPRLQEDVRRRS